MPKERQQIWFKRLRRGRRFALVFAAIWVTFAPAQAMAEEAPKLVVIYPDLRLSFPNIFSQVINGIETHTGRAVPSLSLPPEPDEALLRNWIEHQRPDAIIALGQRAVDSVIALNTKLPIVVGAVLDVPDTLAPDVPVLSLTPEPAILFSYLKVLMPEVERVLVVFNSENDAWLIERAKAAAKNRGLELVARPAADFRSAAQLYREFSETSRPKRDAIWLLQDRTIVDERVSLPDLLRAAWTRNLVVFSNNPNHVKRGVLFAVLPDNVAMGRSLAGLALELVNGAENSAGRRAFLGDTLWAVNVRTAAHLGAALSDEVLRDVNIVFPHP